MGYGSRALEALNAFYSGEYFNLDENARAETEYPDFGAVDHASLLDYHSSVSYTLLQDTDLLTEVPTVRSVNSMPPLLQRLSERKPEKLDYLGVCYGLTPQLLKSVHSANTLTLTDALLQILEARWICTIVPSPNSERADRRAYMPHDSGPQELDQWRTRVVERICERYVKLRRSCN